MSIFFVFFLYPGILGGILRVFFKVVHLRMGHLSCHGYRVAHMIGECDFVTLQFPRTSVIGLEIKFIGAISLRETTGNRPPLRL